MKRHCLPVVALLALLVAGCATETSRTVETPAVASARSRTSTPASRKRSRRPNEARITSMRRPRRGLSSKPRLR